MTKKEIITLLIKDYEEAIEKSKGIKVYKKIKDYLESIELDSGICWAINMKYNIYKTNLEWIKRHKDGEFWTSIPIFLTNKKDILQSLQTRLDILKQELLIPEE